jgi:lipopolysaccharide/colanic/teichoic acid biosynthesis glycosyltransferase
MKRIGLWTRERRLILFLGDSALFAFTAFLCFYIWAVTISRPERIDLAFVLPFVPIFSLVYLGWLLSLIVQGAYDFQMGTLSIAQNMQNAMIATIVVSLGYVVLFFISTPLVNTRVLSLDLSWLAPFGLPRLVVVATLWAAALGLMLWRWLYVRLFNTRQFQWRVMLVEPDAIALKESPIMRLMQQRKSSDFVIADCVLPIDLTQDKSLLKSSLAQGINEIVVASNLEYDGMMRDAIEECHQYGIRITPAPIFYEQLTGMVPIHAIGKQWYVALPFQTKPSLSYYFLKRVIDLCLGLLGLGVLALLLPFVALAIVIDSTGGIFFWQARLGYRGKVFRVLKFRTMTPTGHDPHISPQRITKVGQILRRIRLDELPQVINVLRGEMSIVGPRPDPIAYAEAWRAQIPFYRTRLATKPGLTGWAQVNYGYVVTLDDAIIKLQYDLYYIKHSSIWLDLLIVAKTLGIVIGLRGQ